MGGGHQLATRDASPLKPCDQKGIEIGAGGIDGSGVAGWAGPHNHQILNRHAYPE